MTSIFISYRRADSMAYTGRIYDRLVTAFGHQQIFKDVEDIPVGEDFRSVLDKALTAADVVLVIIGPQWAMMTDDQGRRRLKDPNDFVRIEVETALKRNDVLVVPVLVNNAPMPTADSLPDGLKDLAFRNSVVVRNDPDFHRDINNLIEAIEKRVRTTRPNRTPLIWGGLALAALLVGIIIFGVLPGLNQSTPTPTALAQVVTEEPTATDSPTETPEPTQPATATPEPSAAPTDIPATPTAEPTIEVTAEATTELVSLEPTVAYPDGRPVRFLWNDTSFYVYNPGSTLAFASFKFEAFDSNGQALSLNFAGQRWADNFSNLFRNGCGAIEPVTLSRFLRPSACQQYNSRVPDANSTELFWRASRGVAQFRVLWRDEEIGRCDTSLGECELRLPPA